MEISVFSDDYFMKEAIREAHKALEKNEVPVGAVIVCPSVNGRIIARAHNLTESLNDVTAHAEMQAITAAASYLGGKYLKECTMYVTLEPCVMCAGAMHWAQLGGLVYGAYDPRKGYSRIDASLLHPKTVCRHGLRSDECGEMLRSFFNGKR